MMVMMATLWAMLAPMGTIVVMTMSLVMLMVVVVKTVMTIRVV